ncbi:hypothetical protein MKW92_009012 [Papaver armeniacum]|nr:hypothetical protein MKW92_009012 [Papaver armeniacum]
MEILTGQMVWKEYSMEVASLFFLLIWIRRRKVTAAKTTSGCPLPPGPPGWPVIGNILDIGMKPHINLALLKRQYGPLIWLRLGSINTLVIASAESATELFKNHDHSFCNRYLNEALKTDDAHSGTMVLGEYGPYWRMLKRICTTELFSRKRIKDTAPLRRQCVDKLMQWIADEAKESGTNVELARFVFASSFNVIGNLILSRDLVDPKSSKGNDFFNLNSELTELTAKPNIADLFPALRGLDPQGLQRKIKEKLTLVLAIIGSFVEERRRSMELEGAQNKGRDFLDVLMKFEGSGKDEPAKITDKNLNTLLLELFMVATETTNTSVEWTMTELLSKPEAMKKARDEISQVVGTDRKLEESDIEELHYLQAVIKETMRLHPPVPLLIPRSAIKETELMGYLIPKNTQVFVNVWGIGRDPATWDDSCSLKPERFLGSDVDYRGQNFDFLPFGAGRRMCPGLPLAHQMIHFVVGSLMINPKFRMES